MVKIAAYTHIKLKRNVSLQKWKNENSNINDIFIHINVFENVNKKEYQQ